VQILDYEKQRPMRGEVAEKASHATKEARLFMGGIRRDRDLQAGESLQQLWCQAGHLGDGAWVEVR
jgi:hypothetical protein